ncbi:uncharacterized protein BJ171DRAFT_599408 [Polychytrium aggregatum]|uniref:uncharacterized protein n=1 Tax=Polychytrium aggregatum TaxID=110093 RepID=UPI0022FE745D|nr:uncharacterized protein BJ171DRAFT_599408 [Polychytrium aggregatum]KAI9204241.1 hypothetical protein BJ171DRAFT_599408 [Polychytrium aggregatum]
MSTPLVVIYAFGSAGDVMPMLALGRALHTQCGYRVRIVAPAKWEEKVCKEGLEYFDLKNDPVKLNSEGFGVEGADQLLKLRGTTKGIMPLIQMCVPVLKFFFKTADEHLKGVDLAILTNVALQLREDCEKRGIPTVACYLQPSQATKDYPPPVLGLEYQPDNDKARRSNLMTWLSLGIRSLWIFNPILQERRRALGLRRGFLPSYITAIYDIIQLMIREARARAAMPFICTFSPALVPIASDFKPTMDFVQSGPLQLEADQYAEPFSAPVELDEFLASGKIVYFGYGSLQKLGPTSTKEIDHMTIWLTAIQELESQGVKLRAVFAFSWGPDDVSADPTNTKYHALREQLDTMIQQKKVYRLVGSFPHTYLFPRCHVAVHHGGAGTTQTAAKYRLPAIIVPHVVDQPFMASVAKYRGIANVIDLDDFSTSTLVGALKDILVDRAEYFKKNCDRIGDEMAKENPIGDAVALVQRTLQKARSATSDASSENTAV